MITAQILVASLVLGNRLRLAGLLLHVSIRLPALLLHDILALLLLLPQERTQPGQTIARHHQASRDHRLAARDKPVTATFFVLAAVGLEDVVSALGRQLEGVEGIVEDGGLDLLRVFLHDRKGLVDFGETGRCDLVGFGDVGRDIAVGALRVGEDGLDKLVVRGIGDVDGFLAVGVRLEGVDRVGDDGV